MAARALRLLIDDVLDFSKIEAGELRLEHAEFSLNAILHTTAVLMCESLGKKPVEIVFDVAPDVPDTLMGDPLRLQQVLLNLTSNAVKFTESGAIVLSLKCHPVDGNNVMLVFAIQDSGLGIPEDQLVSIFDRFTQADTSIGRMYGGSGLGLAICVRLAKLMGGTIAVKSQLGRGSEFIFNVPLALGTHLEPTVLAEPLQDLHVLIVEDHALARETLTRTCRGFGWTVTAVGSGSAGLAELERCAITPCDYDVMLLDWRMPDLDGLEMLRQAHATPGVGLPLVVLMVGIFETELAIAASADLELDAIVSKPTIPSGVLEAVARAYSGEYTAARPSAKKHIQRLSGMQLLVAEDNALNQEVIEQILTQAGAECVLVANGELAVAALRAPGAQFDAVLMDLQMHVMDGYTATRIIRDELGLTDLPIIAVTAHARPEDLARSRHAGMVGHLVKPIDVDDLLDLVANTHLPNTRHALVVLADPPQEARSTLRIAGWDVAAALQDFGGDQTRYLQMLDKFFDQHGDDATKAFGLFRAGDAAGAARLLHNLSGIASVLRATELAHQTVAVESAVLNGATENLDGLFDPLQRAFVTLKAEVHRFKAQANTLPIPPENAS